MTDKSEKPKGVSNPEYARAMAELRRSNASGTHQDKRTKRKRTRSDSKRKEIDEQGEG